MHVLRAFFPEGLILKARVSALLEIADAENSKKEDVRRIVRRQGGLRLDEVKSPHIHAIANSLGEHFGLPHDHTKCSVRRQGPEGDKALRWHQDFAPMQLKPGEDGIVCWVPLTPVDGLRPSLMVGEDCKRMSHERDERRFLVIPDDNFAPSDAQIISELDLGDVVVFTPNSPHRTYCNRTMTHDRYSLDLRYSSAFDEKKSTKGGTTGWIHAGKAA